MDAIRFWMMVLILKLHWNKATTARFRDIEIDPYVDPDFWLENHPFCNSNKTGQDDQLRFGVEDGETGKNRTEVYGEILKRHVNELRRTSNRKVDLVFLVDSSASVGSERFLTELNFVKKVLTDFTVDRKTTRVSVITFSSKSRVVKYIDHMTNPKDDHHKCSLFEELAKIEYRGGGTYTIGALLEAQKVFHYARPDAKKALFLITDGYSNGGDPRPAAERLKREGVEIFTFGIREGNFRELCDMASEKKEEHTYILNTFEEFEALARRALRSDLHVGDYVTQNIEKCNSLCDVQMNCCDSLAVCGCGTDSGMYECVCRPGYYGHGLKGGCTACPMGTYKNYTGPGDKRTCMPCPYPNHFSEPGSTSINDCQCKKGFRSTEVHACAAECNEGFVSETGLEPCFPCPLGYFQSERGKSFCYVCPEGVGTPSRGSTRITDCERIPQSTATTNSTPKTESSVTDCLSNPCQKVNECESEPCLNGATCLDLVAHYVCKCSPSFSGINCETQLNSTFDLQFPASGITDYVTIDDPFGKKNLTEFTIAMWLRTDDRQNQGTPVSYATETDDNAFVITDYTGFVVYVNGERRHTDVEVNDGNWHHIAMTWSSQNGAWQIFKDGVVVSNGTGFVAGGAIKGGGVLVVGQEQDSRGGRFSSSESFIGNISKLNMWDTVLSVENIKRLTLTCEEYFGNLIAWPDFLGGINGRVEKLDSQICKGCDSPSNVTYGFVSWNGTGVNDTVSYSCITGYQVDGLAERICLINSTWSGMETRCRKVYCGYPREIQNGYHMGSFYTYGNTIRYLCFSGYRLVGNSTRYCNASALWEGQAPMCTEIICSLNYSSFSTTLRIISFKSTGFRPGDIVRYRCGSGYTLVGQRSMKCNPQGNWDNPLPECVEIRCKSPPSIEYGRALAEGNITYPVSAIVNYECNTGYAISNAKRMRCSEAGIWVSIDSVRFITPFCRLVTCERPGRPKNGYVDFPSGLTYNGTAVYRCEIGYILFGASERRCGLDSTWSDDAPLCKPIGCPQPGDILHGSVIGTEFSYKERIRYICDGGYVLSGSAESSCNSDGTWSTSKPSCDPVKCPEPGNITHGHVLGSTFVLDSVMEFTCKSGFRLVGAKQQKCLANGTWSDFKPTCERVLCPEPIPIQNGEVSGDVYEIGSVIKYTCKKGYVIQGRRTSSCRPNGTWTRATPKCNPRRISL